MRRLRNAQPVIVLYIAGRRGWCSWRALTEQPFAFIGNDFSGEFCLGDVVGFRCACCGFTLARETFEQFLLCGQNFPEPQIDALIGQ